MENIAKSDQELMDNVHRQISEMFRFRESLLSNDQLYQGIQFSQFNQRTFQPIMYVYQNYKEVIQNLRIHCYHFTADTYLSYVQNISSPPSSFLQSYLNIIAGLPSELIIQIPEILGEFGYRINGNLVNVSTVRYQLVVRHLYESGFFSMIGQQRERMVLEIGAGWGGLTHHIQAIMGKRSTCVIVDLPESLYFSAMYLSFANRDKKILIYGEDKKRLFDDPEQIKQYDFVLVPNYALYAIDGLAFDLVLNLISFQEMTPAQVEEYLTFIERRLKGYLYSSNRNRYPDNDEKLAVNDLIQQKFDVVRIFEDNTQADATILIRFFKKFYRTIFSVPLDPLRPRHIIARARHV